mgnify:CR=1 FL=1
MRQKITPTQQEVTFPSDELIVSKTDLAGRITYSNKIFMRLCDFSEETLLGAPHNIIRHPDMPRGVFWGLWHSLKEKREFFGLIKNITASGDFYWVLANVRPDFHDGKPVGYFSVRRSISRQAIAAIEPLYQKMRELEQSTTGDVPKLSWNWLEQHLASQGSDYERFILNLVQQD